MRHPLRSSSAAPAERRWCVRHVPLSRRLATAVLAVAVSVVAAESNPIESCFLAIPFGNGNIASIQLTNADTRNQTATIERYSQGGKLLDAVTRVVQAGESTEDANRACPQPNRSLGGFEYCRMQKRSRSRRQLTRLRVPR